MVSAAHNLNCHGLRHRVKLNIRFFSQSLVNLSVKSQHSVSIPGSSVFRFHPTCLLVNTWLDMLVRQVYANAWSLCIQTSIMKPTSHCLDRNAYLHDLLLDALRKLFHPAGTFIERAWVWVEDLALPSSVITVYLVMLHPPSINGLIHVRESAPPAYLESPASSILYPLFISTSNISFGYLQVIHWELHKF